MAERPHGTDLGNARERGADVYVQPIGFLLELSPDWLIQRASENSHAVLGAYPQALIGEPLSKFTLAQPLHDLRNLFSRQSRGGSIARAYRVRLTADPRYFDLAFQLCDGRILLEGLRSTDDAFGVALGSVSGLLDGLPHGKDARFLDDVARRLRALTGFDRVRIQVDGTTAESSRGAFAPRPAGEPSCGFLGDSRITPVGLFPSGLGGGSAVRALLRSPDPDGLGALRDAGIHAIMDLPLLRGGTEIGRIECDNRAPVAPSIELHAATELFARIVLMRLG